MNTVPRPFWQSVVAGTLHCGAGCSLADLVGPILFRAAQRQRRYRRDDKK